MIPSSLSVNIFAMRHSDVRRRSWRVRHRSRTQPSANVVPTCEYDGVRMARRAVCRTVLALPPEDSKILTSHKRELVPCLSPIRRLPRPAAARSRTRAGAAGRSASRPSATSALPSTEDDVTRRSSAHAAPRTADRSTGSTSGSSAPACSIGALVGAGAALLLAPQSGAETRDGASAARLAFADIAPAMPGTISPTSWPRSRAVVAGARASRDRDARAGARATRSPSSCSLSSAACASR